MTSIGAGAFAKCTALTKVDMLATPAIKIQTNSIPLNAGLQIYVNSTYLSAFKSVYSYYKNYFVAKS